MRRISGAFVPEDSMTLDAIELSLRHAGLTPRGAFHPQADDAVPPLQAGVPARTVVVAGNAGREMWRAYEAARAVDALTLDAWSVRVLDALAGHWGARAVYPFQRPYLPFQRWAARAECCHLSPLGLTLHPDYGLWHGYRGALLFADALALHAPRERPSPCASCTERPCLTACPAEAFDAIRYDVPACVRHLEQHPGGDCMQRGCLARHACPVGGAYRYIAAQAQFHMQAFLRDHAGSANGSETFRSEP